MTPYDSCCWCFSLYTGCMVIAILELIFQTLLTVAFVLLTEIETPAIVLANVIGLSITSILIYGTVAENRSWLWLWVTINILIVLLLGVLVVIIGIEYNNSAPLPPDHGNAMNRLTGIVMAVISIGKAMAQVFYTLIVVSYINKLREMQEPERQHLLPVQA